MPALPEAPAPFPLAELQSRFVDEVLYRRSPGLHGQIVGSGPGAERRLAIYRANARENFALALEAAYPVLLACTGSDEFRRLAWAYQQACPSPAGNLFHAGARLPGFLAAHVRGTPDEYLIDVSRLEWAVQAAMVAADDRAVLDLSALAAVPADRQGDIRFHLHPSVQLLDTEHGVFRLWEAQQTGEEVPRALRGAECLLVRRLATGVQLQRLTVSDLACLRALKEGASLAAAAAVLPGDGDQQLGALLLRWVGNGVITRFTLGRPGAGKDKP